MGHVDASVVIISRDGSDRVLTLLRSLEDQVVEGATFEVVVVDDGSAVPIEPDIVDAGLSTSLRLQVVRCDGDGNRSAARNAGAHVASGEVLIFGDGDQEAPSHWISEHLRWHRRADGLLLVGHRREYGGQGNDAWARRFAIVSRQSSPTTTDVSLHAGIWPLAATSPSSGVCSSTWAALTLDSPVGDSRTWNLACVRNARAWRLR